jgi:ABC-type dipeptide/oligopeptide/nickel transport system permease subunit
MDILFSIIISGLAVGYALAFLISLFERWVDPKYIKLLFTLPLSYVALWLLGFNGAELFVYVPAVGFVSLALMVWFTPKPEVAQVIRRR